MKKISNILLVFSLAALVINFFLLKSFFWQTFLINEWGKTDLKIRIDIINKINSKFPNITNSALPIDAIKSRYFIREGNFDTLPYLIESSNKANPYMGATENIYSQYLYNAQQFDSAYKYSKIAFNKISNNQLHGSVFINTLIKLDSLETAVKIFDNIKIKTPAHYITFFRTLFEIKDTLFVDKYLAEAKTIIPDVEEYKRLEQVRNIGGYNNFLEGEAYSQMANTDYEKGFIDESLKKFGTAVKKNPLNYINYENIGIILFKEFEDSLDRAVFNFKKANELNPESGKALYYLGVIYYSQNKEKKIICECLKKSSSLGYNDAKLLLKKIKCI